jgi:magnesium-transporting ATPase (P-type)
MDKPAPAGRYDASETKPGFHALDVGEVLRAVAGTTSGLTSGEAAWRLAGHGRNELTRTAGRSPVLRFLAHFNNALIYFLLAASVTAFLLDRHVDAAVILAVVLVNAVVGFVQEGKAEKALDAIRSLVSPHAHVLRGRRRVSIPVTDIVPGDIVVLEAGDRVPADVRLVSAHSLLVEEAMLTGESVSAEKQVPPVLADDALGDRRSMAYSGTLVAAGQAMGVVVATGADTEIGRISTLLRDVQPMTTPLLRQINRFGTQVTWIAIAVAAALFVFAVALRDYAAVDALIVVVALAIGFVPEGLPAVTTITLAIGVQRRAKRNSAIRQLTAALCPVL